jgi:hypothetical protein
MSENDASYYSMDQYKEAYGLDGSAGHAADNPDGTCSDLTCPCHQWSRQDAPLVQLPLEHAPLRNLTQAAEAALDVAFYRDWSTAPESMKDDEVQAQYWWLRGRQSRTVEDLNEDLEEMGRLVKGRMG